MGLISVLDKVAGVDQKHDRKPVSVNSSDFKQPSICTDYSQEHQKWIQ